MALLVFDFRAVVNEIPAVQIVVGVRLRIGPLVVGEIRMGEIDATIDNCNDSRSGPSGLIPGGIGFDIRTELPAVLTGVL